MDAKQVTSLEPNSHKYKAEKMNQKTERKKAKPIVSRDKIVSTKKSFLEKFIGDFVNDDVVDIKEWLFMDVIIPGIKDTIYDMISLLLYGEAGSRPRRGASRPSRRQSRYDYRSSYDGSRRNRRERRSDQYSSNDQVDFRNIILRQRNDAEELIEEMRRRIEDTGSVSIAELFDLIDSPSRYTDNNWGWDNVRDIGIRRVATGFLIDVREPRSLE